MSSIYDDPAPNPQPFPSQKPFASEPIQPSDAYISPSQQQPLPPTKKSGCGCVSCLLGCLGVSVVLAIVGGIAAWYVVQKLPDWTRQGIAQAIEESDLEADDKRMVMQQVDRLVDGYKQGKVDIQKLGTLVEDFTKSPLMDLLIAFGAKVKYIDNSGLSPEEKAEAEKTLQRVARGVIEEKITQEQLDVALNHISNKMSNGQRQFKDEVSDEKLREFLKECKRLADEAMVPDEEHKVDIGGELKKLVDKALGELPAEAPEDAKPADTEPTDKKAADEKLGETKLDETKPGDTKPDDAKPE